MTHLAAPGQPSGTSDGGCRTSARYRWVLSEPAREQAITAGLSAEELGAGVQGLLENGFEDTPEGAKPPATACIIMHVSYPKRQTVQGRLLHKRFRSLVQYSDSKGSSATASQRRSIKTRREAGSTRQHVCAHP
jgi:hypothetical protein